MTAAPVSEETAVSEESVTTDVTDISEMTASEISETEETSSSMTLPEGIDPDALISSIAAEEVAEVVGEVSVSEEYVTETTIVQEPLVTEAEAVVSETAESAVTEIVTEVTEVAKSATAEIEVTEVVAVPETPNGVMGFVQSNPAVVGVPAAIIALAVAFLAITRRTRPKRGIIENNDDVKENMNARERDAARLEANKPKKKDKRSQKVAKEKEKKDFAKKVLNTIPYKKILSDDIFFLGKKMYSKAYTFDDINFNLSDEEQQYILHFTDSEIQYVNDTPAGHGILVLGGKTKIPFYDEFPKDTKLYSMMTTNFSETAKMLQEEMAQKESEAS